MVHSEEELKMLVTASQEAGVLEEHEEQMLHRVFGFADLDRRPGDGAAHRAGRRPGSMHARRGLSSGSRAAGHTRLPVYREDLDHVIGILHVTDLLKAIADGGDIERRRRSRAKRSPCRRRWAPTICSPRCGGAACAKRSSSTSTAAPPGWSRSSR